ncbi:DVU_1551 family NTP transferase [Pseudodesulfovibrio tunisiensis]|uniref:DVU_1551 family NTP transferase n=1 Tax=Pseudodesulfovibrio tunisiensis TaxID=463192 RepID=UPI001FB42837|nr:NTP transferase domain-containing protein [Pseudodesulfovibrio tunisiensis]
MTRLGAVIPAAGFSSRMGRFKPLLPLGPDTVLGRCVHAFTRNGLDDVCVVTGFRAEETSVLVRSEKALPVLNVDYEQGMFSSILTGIRALPDDVEAFFVLPVDIPLVRPETVARLARAWEERRAPLVYPVFRGERGHPPLIGRELIPDILRHDGQGGLRRVLENWEDRAFDVSVADSGTVQDLDYGTDYLVALERIGRDYPLEDECLALWDICGVSSDVRDHCRAVGRIARAMCRAMNRTARVERLDPDFAFSAGMVHDIAKGCKGHDQVGADWLAEHGFHAVAPIVAVHSDLAFDPAAGFGEREAVFLADKVVSGSQVVPLEARYAAKVEYFGADPKVRAAIHARRERARRVLSEFENLANVPLDSLAREVLR